MGGRRSVGRLLQEFGWKMTRDLSASQVALTMRFPFYLSLSQLPLDLPFSLPPNPSCVTARRTTPGITTDDHNSVGEWKKLAVGLQTGNSHHFSPFFSLSFPISSCASLFPFSHPPTPLPVSLSCSMNNSGKKKKRIRKHHCTHQVDLFLTWNLFSPFPHSHCKCIYRPDFMTSL